jgi:hypothetical protein
MAVRAAWFLACGLAMNRIGRKKVRRVERKPRLVRPLLDGGRKKQRPGRLQHVEMGARSHQPAKLDYLAPEWRRWRTRHRAAEIEPWNPADARRLGVLSRLLAEYDAIVAGDGLDRRPADRVDVRVETAQAIEQTVSCQVRALSAAPVGIVERQEIRELGFHEPPEVPVGPKSVGPPGIPFPPALWTADAFGRIGVPPGLVNKPRYPRH